MPTFVDRVVVHATAGNGGHGCTSIHREKFKPLGGPDGGSGGRGGDIVLVVDTNVTTLLDFHFHPHARASSGRPGQGSHRSGADGDDLVLPVPDGTVVRRLLPDGSSGPVLADLVGAGTRYVLAAGGSGGRGNAALVSARRRAPGFALLGEPGEARDVVLELRSVADVALVGFPSAGKSSLVSVLSAAKPKIADYPFTTLVPNLGVAQADGGRVFTLADVPGLIPGAAQGRGLGLEFLRHIERCSVIVHVLDCGTLEPGRDPLSDLDAIEAELAAYDEIPGRLGQLRDRPRLVVLNKVDLPEAAELAELVTPDLAARGLAVFPVSAVSRTGLRELARALAERVEAARAAAPDLAPTVVLRPRPLRRSGGGDFAVAEVGPNAYTISGEQPERWVRQTDFSNAEAVGYLGERLARLGVEAELATKGATPGAEVTIGDVTFDWEPSEAMAAAGEAPLGPRGSDLRIDGLQRPSAARRAARARAAGASATPVAGEPHRADGAEGAADLGDPAGTGETAGTGATGGDGSDAGSAPRAGGGAPVGAADGD